MGQLGKQVFTVAGKVWRIGWGRTILPFVATTTMLLKSCFTWSEGVIDPVMVMKTYRSILVRKASFYQVWYYRTIGLWLFSIWHDQQICLAISWLSGFLSRKDPTVITTLYMKVWVLWSMLTWKINLLSTMPLRINKWTDKSSDNSKSHKCRKYISYPRYWVLYTVEGSRAQTQRCTSTSKCRESHLDFRKVCQTILMTLKNSEPLALESVTFSSRWRQLSLFFEKRLAHVIR